MDGRWSVWVAGGLICLSGGCSSLGLRPGAADRPPGEPEAQAAARPPEGKPKLKPETLVILAQTREAAAEQPGRTPAERERLLESARFAYEQALEADPAHSPALRGLGNLYSRLGDSRLALEMYQRAAELNPHDVGAWYDLGICHARAKDWAGATRALGEALKIDPQNRACTKGMGFCLVCAGRAEEGYAWLRKVMPEAEARFNLAQAHYQMRQDDASRRQAILALKADPGHAGARDLLAKLQPSPPAGNPAAMAASYQVPAAPDYAAAPPAVGQPFTPRTAPAGVGQVSGYAPAPAPAPRPEPVLTSAWDESLPVMAPPPAPPAAPAAAAPPAAVPPAAAAAPAAGGDAPSPRVRIRLHTGSP